MNGTQGPKKCVKMTWSHKYVCDHAVEKLNIHLPKFPYVWKKEERLECASVLLKYLLIVR